MNVKIFSIMSILMMILVEQIYRAFKINRNEPYHY